MKKIISMAVMLYITMTAIIIRKSKCSRVSK